MEKIEIDKNGEAPLYLQLARQIEQQVADGILVPGERLLSEIKMANESGLSVGTVKKAYAWLQDRGVVQKIRGGGAYVQEKKSGNVQGKEKSPSEIVEEMFSKVSESGMPMNRLFLLAQQELVSRFQEKQKICAALVECNVETLHSIAPVVESIPNLTVETYVLSDLLTGNRVIWHLSHRAIIRSLLGMQMPWVFQLRPLRLWRAERRSQGWPPFLRSSLSASCTGALHF